jgi:hypothetical protein
MCHGTAMSKVQLMIGESAGGLLDVFSRATGDRPLISHPFVVFPLGVTEQQAADVLDAVEIDLYGDAVRPAVDLGGGYEQFVIVLFHA